MKVASVSSKVGAWVHFVTSRSPRAAERRWPRLADSDTDEHSSARYVDAAWCRHLYTRTHTLYSILCWTSIINDYLRMWALLLHLVSSQL